jgi:hypothetical protein
VTPLETILGSLTVAGVSGALAYVMGSHRKVNEKDCEERKTVIDKRIDDHIKDPVPHRDCPVHTTQIFEMNKKLDKIDAKLDTLLER